MRLLGEYGSLQLDKMEGSGPFGRILKGDILRYIAKHKVEPSPKTGWNATARKTATDATDGVPQAADSRRKFTDRPVANAAFRQEIMAQKLHTPHYYAHTTVIVGDMRCEEVLDRVKRAVEAALRHYPGINGHRRGEVVVQNDPTEAGTAPASSGVAVVIRNWEVLAWDVVRDGVPVVSFARRGDGRVVVGLSADARAGEVEVGGFLERVKGGVEGDLGVLL